MRGGEEEERRGCESAAGLQGGESYRLVDDGQLSRRSLRENELTYQLLRLPAPLPVPESDHRIPVLLKEEQELGSYILPLLIGKERPAGEN